MSKDELQRMLELEPDNIDLLVENARLARIGQEINKAKNYLLLAMQKDPNNSLVNVEFGLLLYEINQKKESKKYFEKAKSNINANNFVEFLYLLEVFWSKKYFDFCKEIIMKLTQKDYKKKETEFLEKLYDNLYNIMRVRLFYNIYWE